VNVAARLQAAAEPGGILLSQSAVDQLKGHTAHGFRALGERRFKNLPDPVRVYVPTALARRRRIQVPWRFAGAAALSLIAGLAVGWALWFSRASTPGEPLPTVALLPFANLSGDPGQDYFGDGLTEDLIGALGRFRELRV